MPLPFYHSEEDYRLLHSRSKAMEEWDVYHSAIYFESAVGSLLDPHDGNVKFWYNGEFPGHKALNSVQSMYLWGYSRVPAMPTIDDRFWIRMTDVRYLVALGLTDDEVNRALDALSRSGIKYAVLRRDRFDSATWSIRFVIVEMPRNLHVAKTQ